MFGRAYVRAALTMPRASAAPYIGAGGVRSSCDTVETKSYFSRSSACSAVRSRNANTAPPANPTPVTDSQSSRPFTSTGRVSGATLSVAASVVDGDRRASRQVEREVQVVLVVEPGGVGADEHERAESAAAGDQRHDHRRLHPELLQRLVVVFVLRGG